MVPGDDRGVSPVIGGLLLFGVVVVAFASFQAFVVPAQNAEVEYALSQDVQSDFQELRNGVVAPLEPGKTRPVSVRLGTTYPPRAFASNPGPPSASLRTETVAAGGLSVPGVDAAELCGTPVTTRALVHQPSYNAYQRAPTTVYENTVTYRRFDDGHVVDSSQALVNGNTISLYPVMNDVSRAGSGTVSVDLRSSRVNATTVSIPASNPVLVLPTRLSASVWRELLSDQPAVTGVADSVAGDSLVAISLDPSREYRVRCRALGLNAEPPDVGPGPGGGDGGDDAPEINPAAPGNVKLQGVSYSSNTVTMSLNNTGGSDVAFREARIAFYDASQGGKSPDYGRLEGNTSDELVVGDDYEPVARTTVPADSPPRDVTVSFYEERAENSDKAVTGLGGDFFILVVQWDNGVQATYFVAIPG